MYIGSQAIKALKESDAKIILVNPNIATVQTSKGMAHVTYFLPITFEYVKQIIEKEKPDGIMCAFGGQTGLNVGIELYQKNVLTDNNCEILGKIIPFIILFIILSCYLLYYINYIKLYYTDGVCEYV